MGKRYLSRVKEYYACVTRDLSSTWANESRASSLSVEMNGTGATSLVGPALLLMFTQCSRFTNLWTISSFGITIFVIFMVSNSFRFDTVIYACDISNLDQ